MMGWGGASWRQYQKFQPNEAIFWYAMRYWKARGMQTFDMCGGGEYKRKYGGRRIVVPWGRLSRFRIFSLARRAAAKVFWLRWKLVGYLRNRGEEGHAGAAAEDSKDSQNQESGQPEKPEDQGQ